MSSVLEASIVLSLNRNWERLGWTTPKDAFIALNGGFYGTKPAAMGLDITLNEEGELTNAVPLNWEDWVKLPVRDGDLSIATAKGAVRVPLVIIRPGFSKMPLKRHRLCSAAIFNRDGGICQYSGEYVPKGQGNVDHVIPRSRGGKDVFENLVWTKKKINSEKGDRLNEEVGLKLLKKPLTPKPIPVSYGLGEPKLPAHAPFFK
jgi:HNH endonuclease